MKTQTILTNGTNEIVLNTEVAIKEMFTLAQAAGFPAGKTSFFNLFKGNTKEVKGYHIEVREVATTDDVEKQVKAARRNKLATAQLATKMLSEVEGVEVKNATRKTYGTIKADIARIQLDPRADGNFNVWMYDGKNTATLQEMATLLNNMGVDAEPKAQYVKAFNVTAAQVETILNA